MGRALSVLQLTLSVGETSIPYSHFALRWADELDVSVCTYFPSDVIPPSGLELHQGDGTLRGFFRTLTGALNAKDYDIIHAHTPHVGLLYLIAKHLRSSAANVPATAFTVHSSFPNYRAKHYALLLPVFAFFERIICCSHASLSSVPGFYRWLGGKRLCAVPNGVELHRVDNVVGKERHYRCQDDGQGGQDAFTLTALGRLIEVKNPLSALRAFAQAADAHTRLLVIGEGPLRGAFTAMSEALGVNGQIELTGLIGREQVYQRLAGTDLLVSTSRVEGMPIAVLEAMACRCPVLLSDIPSHREIAEGVDFIPLVPPDDHREFARQIVRFKQMSAAELADIGHKCRELVEERFSLSSMHRDYGAIYAQLSTR